MLNHTSGMPDEIEVSGRVPGAFKSGESGSDIFAMVKATMASKTLSQPPLLVWPSSMQDVSKKAVQTANGHGCPSVGCSLDTARRDELRLMLAGFRRDFPHMKRTMAWYQKMVDGLEEDSAKGLPQLTFLKDVVANKNLGQHLQDVFGGGTRLEEECHNRAWEAIQEYMDSHLKTFSGKMMDGEPVIMPQVRSWARSIAMDLSSSTEDHCVIMLMSCPTAGILTGLQKSFINTFVCNLIADFPLNSCCLLVHPNRAGQSDTRTAWKPAAKKEEEEPPAVKDQDQESDDESDEDEKDREDVDVRDIRYKIETQFALKEKGLKVRNVSPAKNRGLPHLGRAFTDAQEMRSALDLENGGMDQLDCSNTGGTKIITPIRPVMALVGNLDLGEATESQDEVAGDRKPFQYEIEQMRRLEEGSQTELKTEVPAPYQEDPDNQVGLESQHDFAEGPKGDEGCDGMEEAETRHRMDPEIAGAATDTPCPVDTAFIDDMGDMTALALQQVEKTIQGKVSDPAVPAEEVSELAKTALEHCTSMLDCLETIASMPSGPVFSVEEEQALRLAESLENAEVAETQMDPAPVKGDDSDSETLDINSVLHGDPTDQLKQSTHEQIEQLINDPEQALKDENFMKEAITNENLAEQIACAHRVAARQEKGLRPHQLEIAAKIPKQTSRQGMKEAAAKGKRAKLANTKDDTTDAEHAKGTKDKNANTGESEVYSTAWVAAKKNHDDPSKWKSLASKARKQPLGISCWEYAVDICQIYESYKRDFSPI
ncbi:unnamed protein product [Durusdinium trenchii]|uniref:Uncharacterized protein n=1 Tax=Durusdinium trenchii TaxID=1381693 RepID=A0ABP0SD59_9DINO